MKPLSLVILFVLLCAACSPAAEPAAPVTPTSPPPTASPYTETSLAEFAGEPGVIKIKIGENTIEFLGDGVVFAAGTPVPMVPYVSDETGAIDMVTGMMSPFVRINPAILDLSDLDFGIFPVFIQKGEADVFLQTAIIPGLYPRFLIDTQFIVYPLTDADVVLELGGESPYLAFNLYNSADQQIELDSITVEVESISQGVLKTAPGEEGMLIVKNVPLEPLKITIKQGEFGWVHQAYPAFRSAVPGIVEYKIRGITINQAVDEKSLVSRDLTDPDQLVVGSWKCKRVSWQFLEDGSFVWDNQGYQETGSYSLEDKTNLTTTFSSGYSETKEIVVSYDRLYFKGSDLCTRVQD